MPALSPATPPARRIRPMIAVMVLVPVLVSLALWAFAWPAARMAPNELPIGVAGPAAATAQLEQNLAQHEEAFEIRHYDDEAAAREAIEDRDVYGAMVVTTDGPKVLTASAASPVVAALLKESAAMAAPEGTRPVIEDVVPASPDDPRGSALASSILPLALAGIAAGASVTLLGLRGWRAATALSGTAALSGLVATAIAHSWLGALTGAWWTEAGVLTLTVLAVGGGIAGLAAVLGREGIGLGALLIMLIGNPFSGVGTAPELLPEPAGLIGQWLPPGAGGSLLRSVTFFDGAGAASPAIVLTLWALLGLTAVLIGGRRRVQSPARQPVPDAAPTA
ncbi:ABC transporter permease [Streptomyces sp. SCSIO 30461]|uniref:ABC transporter permease n=1 Tax=Streptomyces sp. SCSIO 30461 TaxID=3118085 RepID=UPI0030D4E4DE